MHVYSFRKCIIIKYRWFVKTMSRISFTSYNITLNFLLEITYIYKLNKLIKKKKKTEFFIVKFYLEMEARQAIRE